QKLKQRVEYLINDLKVYQDYDHGKKGLRHAVKHDLYDGNYLRIEDKYGQLLIYRLPISSQYTETLTATAHLIPPSPATEHRRDHTSEKYWGWWRKYKMELYMTGEYKKDFPASQQWLDANQAYFKHMSNVLRLLDPRVYVKYTSVNQFLPEGLKPTCGIWHTCGIMRDMMAKRTPYKDPSDYHCGFNWEPKKKRRRLGLEELRARNNGESSLGEIGNAPESTQDGGDSDTEGEMEALYYKGVQEELGKEEDQEGQN
ncbi:MAG: hypothetical protein M1840_003353, partial [Geoglossum simile]